MDSTDGEFRSGPQKTELPAFKLKTSVGCCVARGESGNGWVADEIGYARILDPWFTGRTSFLDTTSIPTCKEYSRHWRVLENRLLEFCPRDE